MAGRTDGHERRLRFARRQPPGRVESGPCGEHGGHERAFTHAGIGVDVPAPEGLELLQATQVWRRMHPLQGFGWRGHGYESADRVDRLHPGDPPTHGLDPLRSLGVTGTRVVLTERWVVGDEDLHDSEARRPRPGIAPSPDLAGDRMGPMGRTADRTRYVTFGVDRLRIGPWRGDASIAYVAPTPGVAANIEALRAVVTELCDRGYRHAVTSALAEQEQQPFLTLGWEVSERLHLLAHDLVAVPDPPPVRTRRARWSDRTALLDIDRAAFDEFWRFDAAGLADARAATATSRLRVAGRMPPSGYAITGRSGSTAYLQRLAVRPEHQGQGIGTALCIDALSWARRRCTRVLVNTQEANGRALDLYRRLNFVDEPSGLAVLRVELDAVESGRVEP